MSKGSANCGLVALEQMAAVKTVSMFSLIHLAKDNGLNLYFCKVEPEELMEVQRPAIFHQKDHFVFVENGNPLPSGEYDGYVLTPKPLHEPLPYSLAKKIRGRKNAMSFLGPVVTGIASVVSPVLGAVVGAGFGAVNAAKTGEWWRIPLGGATGYLQGAAGGSTLGIGNSTLAAGLAAAGEVPGAIKTGNWMAPVAAGIGQYMGAQAIGGAQSGMAAAQPGFMNQIGGAAKGAIGAFTGGAQKLSTGSAPSGGIEIAKSSMTAGATPAGYSGSYTIPGVGNSVVGIPGISGPAGYSAGAMGLAGGAAPAAAATPASSGFDLSKILGGGGGKGGGFGGLSNLQILGMGASTLMSPPENTTDMSGNFSRAAQYLGGDSWNALPTATRKQLEEYTAMPLDQLATKMTAQDDKGLRMLEEKHQQEKDQLMATYANYGQDPYTSTDAQQRLTELNRQYDQAKAEYQQQIQNQAMTQAVDFKKQILSQSIQQNQFDYNSFMELATYYGYDQQAKYAMDTKNYDQLQQILAEIFSIGQYNPNRQA
ncbi:MAG: hypothetical protein WC750_05985 [Patescibacteria group bacterium]|jgi:hypothetical protein